MQHKMHMQDQITDRIKMIMDERHEKVKQVIDDIATFSLVLIVVALGVVW